METEGSGDSAMVASDAETLRADGKGGDIVGPHHDGAGGHNLSSLAYRSISEMIRHRRLRGGEVIIEQRLAEELGVSRTPLREALQRLEGEGLVKKVANKSFSVRRVDLREYLEALKVREILEPEAAVMAIGNIVPQGFRMVRQELAELVDATHYDIEAHRISDDNVHGLFAHACGNSVLAETIQLQRVTTHLFEIGRLADRVEPDAREHLAIIDALEVGDARVTRRTVRGHIRSLMRYAVKLTR